MQIRFLTREIEKNIKSESLLKTLVCLNNYLVRKKIKNKIQIVTKPHLIRVIKR